MASSNLERYPGGELVQRGIRDLGEGRQTAQALLVAIATTRLRSAGVRVPPVSLEEPELRLYELLAIEDPDSAHGRYNALLRRLVSFERAVEAASRPASDSTDRASRRRRGAAVG